MICGPCLGWHGPKVARRAFGPCWAVVSGLRPSTARPGKIPCLIGPARFSPKHDGSVPCRAGTAQLSALPCASTFSFLIPQQHWLAPEFRCHRVGIRTVVLPSHPDEVAVRGVVQREQQPSDPRAIPGAGTRDKVRHPWRRPPLLLRLPARSARSSARIPSRKRDPQLRLHHV